jgi:NAD(P)-dependent dehydrogenase (short-subunit alcohol dehydrogenase family)
MMDLSGKTVVITGASRGIGAGLAKECVERGMNVVVCARSKPPIDETERTLAMVADVTDEGQVNALCAAAAAKFGHIDLGVNNAGVLEPIAPLRECDSAQVHLHLNVNVMGVFHGTKAFINHLHDKGGEGALINISSGASTSAYAGWGAYCAGKAAVDRMTEVAQLEEEAHGLRAYAVAPGIIDTQMQELIRGTSAEKFPMVDKFLELKANDSFSSPEFVAQRLLELAFDPEHRPDSVCLRLPMEKEPA